MLFNDWMLLIIGGAAIGVMLANVLPIAYYARKWTGLKKVRPLDCEYCMAFWVSVITCIFLEKKCIDTIYISASAAVLARLLNSWL